MQTTTSIHFSQLKSEIIAYYFKALFVLSFLTLSSSGLFAQTKWAPKGAKWYYTRPYLYSQGASDNYGDCVVFESLGDTLVNHQHAIALNVRSCSGKNISTEVVKQSGDTLFYLNHDIFYPLYNFSAKIGDTITVHPDWFEPVKACLFDNDTVNGFQYTITAIDSVKISGKWLKRQTVNRVGGNWGFWSGASSNLYVIEKLGSLAYFFGRFYLVIPEEKITLLRCYSDSTTVYHNPQWAADCDLVGIKEIKGQGILASIQNYRNNTLSIQLNKPAEEAKMYIYDMGGRMLGHQILKKDKTLISVQYLKTGVYFLKIVTATNTQTDKFIKW